MADLLLYMYVRLDSDKHPVRNYGDIMHITLSKPVRIISQSMQVFQLIFVTAVSRYLELGVHLDTKHGLTA